MTAAVQSPLVSSLAIWLLTVVATLTQAGTTQAATPVTAPVRIVGGEDTRTITLSSCRITRSPSPDVIAAMDTGRCVTGEAPGGARGSVGKTQLVAVGQLLLAVQNTTGSPLTVGLRYVRKDGHAARLPGCSTLAQLADRRPHPRSCTPCPQGRTPCPSHVAQIRAGPHSVVTLPLRFALLSNEPPQALQGAIYIHACHQTLVVPVAAGVRDVPDIQLESSVMRISADDWHLSELWGGKSAPVAGTITVTGPGVGAMLARQSPTARRIVLRNGAGEVAELELETFKAEYATLDGAELKQLDKAKKAKQTLPSKPEEPLRASAKLKLVNLPHMGAYHGQIGLSELDPNAPSLDVQLRTHLPLWLAIFCVFLGVLAATVIAPLALLRGRTTDLRDALENALRHYERAEGILWAAGYVGENRNALWDPNSIYADGAGGTVAGDSREVGLINLAEMLLKQIDGERDDDDFDEDHTLVLDVTARLSRWLRVAPAAIRLRQVADAAQQQANAAGVSLADTATVQDTLLLQKQLMREPKDPGATDDLVGRVLRQAYWHRAYSGAITRAHRDDREDIAQQLEDLDQTLKTPSVLERKPEEQDRLEIKLESLREDLGLSRMPKPPQLPGERELDVNWQAPPNLFSGWSTLDAASLRKLSIDAEQRVRTKRDWKQWLHDAFRDMALWGWTLFFTLVISIVYALTIYNSTWGSTKDVLTALTAGFAGAVTLKIALPIFKSQRLRPSAPSPSPQTPQM